MQRTLGSVGFFLCSPFPPPSYQRVVTARLDGGVAKRPMLFLFLCWTAGTRLWYPPIPFRIALASASLQASLQKAVCNLRYQLSVLAGKYCEAWNCVHRLSSIPPLAYCSFNLHFIGIDQVVIGRHVVEEKLLPPEMKARGEDDEDESEILLDQKGSKHEH